jgi:hypothetical protein
MIHFKIRNFSKIWVALGASNLVLEVEQNKEICSLDGIKTITFGVAWRLYGV